MLGRHYSGKNMRGCRQRQKHQRSEPSIHFLIYVINLHKINTLIYSVLRIFSAEFLAQRSWKGLEVKRGETQVTKAVEGRSGIASGYTHELVQDDDNT